MEHTIYKKKVSLFVQCLVDAMYPKAGLGMAKLLAAQGLDLDYPLDQTCCGQPAFNSGFRKEAAEAAKHFMNTFAHAETIVGLSGSCVAMIKEHYPVLFADDPLWHKKALETGAKVFEFTQFMVDVLNVERLGCDLSGVSVTYHDSCHLKRTLGLADQPRKLIKMTGADLIEMEKSDTCCGFGGAFSVKYPEISTALAEEKVDHIAATGAEIVTGCDAGCLMNIQGIISRRNLAVKVVHIARLLTETPERLRS